MEPFIQYLKTFVHLQNGLWDELLRELSVGIGPFLLNIPKSGVIEFENKKWRYTKHGLGIRFEEENRKRTIDFHKVSSGASKFNAWGLATYFGSLGGEGRKVLKTVGMISCPPEDKIKEVLLMLEKDYVIRCEGGFCSLN
jgi:hypothetical protein